MSTEIPKLNKIETIFCGEEILVPENVNILINDVGATQISKETIRKMLLREILFLEPSNLSDGLARVLQEKASVFKGKRTAVLYPLYGAQSVRKSLDLRPIIPYLDVFQIRTSRSSPFEEPLAEIPRNFLQKLRRSLFDTVLIVDDVIAYGNTARAIKEDLEYLTTDYDETSYNRDIHFGWSNLETKKIVLSWYIAAWIIRAEPKSQISNLSGFDSVFGSVYFKGVSGRTPVNSLSTFISSDIKGSQILFEYAQMYARSPDEFKRFIKNLTGGDGL